MGVVVVIRDCTIEIIQYNCVTLILVSGGGDKSLDYYSS